MKKIKYKFALMIYASGAGIIHKSAQQGRVY